jgi:hypothetical protein
MTKSQRALERQRERIVALVGADPERSSRSIAAEVGCGVNTVIRARERHVPRDAENGTTRAAHAGSENLLPPAAPGNDRAVRHGAYSQARRAPLEVQHRERLRGEFPSAPDDVVNVMARRLAMGDLYAAWLADHGPVRGRGDVAPAARELRLLLSDHERAYAALGEFEGNASARPRDTLASIEAEHAAVRAEAGVL